MKCCAYCGTKGGFVNHLITYVVSPYGDELYECEWCSIKTTDNALKGISQ